MKNKISKKTKQRGKKNDSPKRLNPNTLRNATPIELANRERKEVIGTVASLTEDMSQLHPPISTENRTNEGRIPVGGRRRRQLLKDDDKQDDIPRVRSKTVEVSTSETPSQVSGPIMRINATEQGNDGVGANALDQNQNTVLPPAPETNHLKRLRISMNEFRAKYPTNRLNAWQYATSAIGKFKKCYFYVSDDEKARGMAFRAAYDGVAYDGHNHQLCTFVGSMLCDVFPGFRSSVEAALNGTGVKTQFLGFPSKLREYKVAESEFSEMDWPSILLSFGCCVLALFMKTTDEENYRTFMTGCIYELKVRAGCDPDDFELNRAPFDFSKANAIRTMLGASSNLRAEVIKFLISNIDRGDTGLGGVCQYLCNMLSWSEMGDFTLTNEELVKIQSPVLLDCRVSREVDNLTEACAAIASYPYPQFFMHLASNLERLKVEPLRFPTLIAVAKELERGDNNCITIADSVATPTSAGAKPNPTTVRDLVELHRMTMAQNLSGLKLRVNATKQGNGVGANALDQNLNTFPPAPETNHLKRLRVSMNEFRARYPTNQLNVWRYATCSAIGNFKDCKFYLSDDEKARGMAFRVAYNGVAEPLNNHELCTCVGSMLCDVFPGFRSSVEAALNGIGVKPLFVRLPSKDRGQNMKESNFSEMDWPSTLVIFGCCVLALFIKTHVDNYETFMHNCIGELKVRAGCDPDAADIDIPFEFCFDAEAIRTMLGASSNLRANVVKFLISNIDRGGDTGLGGVCQYLCNVLSWSQMGEFTLMNEELVRTQSPVLLDRRVSREVENLTEACEAVASHPHPQFFMHLASNSERLKVEPLRFPTLIAVAKELEKGDNNCFTAANSVATPTSAGAKPNPTTVRALVELHRMAMAQNCENNLTTELD